MAFGIAIGRGETPQRVLAEGSKTVAKLAKLAKTKGIELPITNAVNELVNNGQNLHHVVTELLSRPAGLE